ncbi:cache domain-containing protein, partial [Pseudomonas aeruginosa]|uniref:cache domain-containing protein n=1 Tax=Pseudomonas aeruginosa TaxID=287 RepID=UPI002F90E052
GRERLYLSRLDPNRIGSGIERSGDPAVSGARSAGVWYGPVTYNRGTEPFMTMAVAGNRQTVGVATARINLKGIWDVVSAIHVGRTGQAFVLDRPGRLVAHPDLSLVLRGTDDAASEPLRRLRDAILAGGGEVGSGEDGEGRTLLAALTSIPGVDWT